MQIFRNHIRWFVIFWMFAISAIAFLDRVNISIAGKAIEAEFRLEHVQLGWVFSAFVLGYALFQAPGGRLADRFGPRTIVTGGTIWWAVFTALTGSLPGGFRGALSVLIATRFLLGVGESVVYPASNRLVASWIPSHERGVANGLIFAGVGAGAGIAPPLITHIMQHQGWRWSFWISAIIGLAAGIIWFLSARDKPQDHPFVTHQESAYIHSGISGSAVPSGTPLTWGTILTSKDVVARTRSYCCYGYVAYIFFSWFFIYLNAVRELDLNASSHYAMLPFLAMATGSPLGGWISDLVSSRFGPRIGRCGVACASMALASVFVVVGAYASEARLASVVLAGGAGALYLAQSAYWSVSSELGGSSAGSVSGVMNMGAQIGGVVTASLTPWIAKHFGWDTSFFVAAAVCAFGSITWLLVHPDRRIADSPHPGAHNLAPR
ncbi:MAG: MFS transporter [Acidobacteria bacterium]|nr:MFS transporter [Acidobacteriota bacterium]